MAWTWSCLPLTWGLGAPDGHPLPCMLVPLDLKVVTGGWKAHLSHLLQGLKLANMLDLHFQKPNRPMQILPLCKHNGICNHRERASRMNPTPVTDVSVVILISHVSLKDWEPHLEMGIWLLACRGPGRVSCIARSLDSALCGWPWSPPLSGPVSSGYLTGPLGFWVCAQI